MSEKSSELIHNNGGKSKVDIEKVLEQQFIVNSSLYDPSSMQPNLLMFGDFQLPDRKMNFRHTTHDEYLKDYFCALVS